jgi:hypothetical protein
VNEPDYLESHANPHALAILHALFDHRLDGVAEIGFVATRAGARVDWSELQRSWLSSNEKAAVQIAHGCAVAERHGGLGPGMRWVLLDAMSAVCQ